MQKKEAAIAIFIGLIIGLVITGGILRARKALEKTEAKDNSNSPASQKPDSLETQTSQKLFLNITNPTDNSISDTDIISLNGQTLPDTYVAIIAEKSEHLIVPNEVGQFSQDIDLVSGANIIKVTVYTDSGEKIEKVLNVVYTTAEI